MKYVFSALILLLTISCTSEEKVMPTSKIMTKDGLAIGGYDPVAYFVSGEAQKGSPNFEIEWSNAKWLFSSAENLEMFRNNPTRYAPQFGGHCAFAASLGKAADGSPTAWSVVDEKLYLNANRFVTFLWKALPERMKTSDVNY